MQNAVSKYFLDCNYNFFFSWYSINYSHSLESLSKIPNPVKKNEKNIKERPDLNLLNKELLRAGGDGWHPLTPLRTGLMELLAQNL